MGNPCTKRPELRLGLPSNERAGPADRVRGRPSEWSPLVTMGGSDGAKDMDAVDRVSIGSGWAMTMPGMVAMGAQFPITRVASNCGRSGDNRPRGADNGTCADQPRVSLGGRS